jgi:hypothetical protein
MMRFLGSNRLLESGALESLLRIFFPIATSLAPLKNYRFFEGFARIPYGAGLRYALALTGKNTFALNPT